MKKIRNKLLLAGSLASTVLVAGAFTANATQDAIQAVETLNTRTVTQSDESTKKIGAFSNLDSFDNDGFNGGVKAAAESYTGSWADVDHQTSEYSDDGKIYVPLLETQFETSDIIISAGFQVAGALTGLSGVWDGVFTKADGTNTSLANSSDKSFVLLDDDILPKLYTNAASVSFNAEGAGFLAGIGAAVYTEYDAITNGKENPNIVMWGGMAFPTVYSFLSGFAQAIDWTNETYAGTTIASGETYKEITIWSGGSQAGDTINASNTHGTSTNPTTWYTFGFDASVNATSGKAAQIKTNNAIDAGASVIFPVAGGNTTVAETTLFAAEANTTKLMGVDADATMSSANDELYIGTAGKNLKDGGNLALWAMDDDNGDGTRNYLETDMTSRPAELDSWINEEGSVEGLQLTGNIENGGVSFIYDAETGQEAGINADFALAIQTVLGAAVGEESASMNSLLDEASAANPEIQASMDEFLVDDGSNNNDSNLTWLWITLGVIAALSIIGALVWYFVFKK